jgi:hypothetical protein
MHNNPVKRKLASSPADWPWSSWRFYHLGDRSILEMDRLDEERREVVGGEQRMSPKEQRLAQT